MPVAPIWQMSARVIRSFGPHQRQVCSIRRFLLLSRGGRPRPPPSKKSGWAVAMRPMAAKAVRRWSVMTATAPPASCAATRSTMVRCWSMIMPGHSPASSERKRTRSSCALAPGDDLPDEGRPGDHHQRAVHGLVQGEEGREVLPPHRDVLVLQEDAQHVERAVGRLVRGIGDGPAFQRLAHELAVVDGGNVDRGDEGADLRDDAQEAVLAQAPEYFAHGGAAEAVALGDLGFGQGLAGAEFAVHDLAVQVVVDLLAGGAGGELG